MAREYRGWVTEYKYIVKKGHHKRLAELKKYPIIFGLGFTICFDEADLHFCCDFC